MFRDEVRGEITFDTTELGDFVIARSVTEPLYHLAVVIDDHDMGITHVIRGEDHIYRHKFRYPLPTTKWGRVPGCRGRPVTAPNVRR